jgi:dTDP-4-amino-4,6-dideoxygalactose transaminase
MPYARHVYHVYGVLVKNRDEVARKLQDAGIGTNVHYPNPIHLQPCFAELGHRRGDFPNAERQADEELSLPMFPEISPTQVGEVVGCLRNSA